MFVNKNSYLKKNLPDKLSKLSLIYEKTMTIYIEGSLNTEIWTSCYFGELKRTTSLASRISEILVRVLLVHSDWSTFSLQIWSSAEKSNMADSLWNPQLQLFPSGAAKRPRSDYGTTLYWLAYTRFLIFNLALLFILICFLIGLHCCFCFLFYERIGLHCLVLL